MTTSNAYPDSTAFETPAQSLVFDSCRPTSPTIHTHERQRGVRSCRYYEARGVECRYA